MDPQRYHSGVPSASGSNQKRDWRKWSLVPTNQFENLKQPMIEAAASDTHRCQRAATMISLRPKCVKVPWIATIIVYDLHILCSCNQSNVRLMLMSRRQTERAIRPKSADVLMKLSKYNRASICSCVDASMEYSLHLNWMWRIKYHFRMLDHEAIHQTAIPWTILTINMKHHFERITRAFLVHLFNWHKRFAAACRVV